VDERHDHGGAVRGVPNTASGDGSSGRGKGKRALGELLASVSSGLEALIREHSELAKLELAEAVSTRAIAAGVMAAAGLLGAIAVVFLAAAMVMALALVMPTWAANLVMAVLFAAAAGGAVLTGRHALRTAPKAFVRTQEMLKEDAGWARQQIAR